MLDVGRVHIVGHSLGGMIGTLLLSPLQDITESFVNMEGNLVSSDCGLSKEVSQHPYSIFQSDEFAQIKNGLKHSPARGSADRARWVDEIPDFAFYKACQSIVEWSAKRKILDLFEGAHCRKLFVYGAASTKKADYLPKAIERIEIPGAGHFMLQDNPAPCYRAIQNFLQPESV